LDRAERHSRGKAVYYAENPIRLSAKLHDHLAMRAPEFAGCANYDIDFRIPRGAGVQLINQVWSHFDAPRRGLVRPSMRDPG
jgi:hypothetical protein